MSTPTAPPERYPDAVMVPRPFRGLTEPHQLLKRLFLPLFDPAKARNIYVRAQPAEGVYFITADPNDSRFFGTGHPLQGLSRYDWFLVGETDSSPLGEPKLVRRDTDSPRGVKLGWLRDAEAITPAVLSDKIEYEREYADQLQKFLPKVQRYQKLARTPVDQMTDEERAEHADLTKLLI